MHNYITFLIVKSKNKELIEHLVIIANLSAYEIYESCRKRKIIIQNKR